jgi:hypothetical protein
MWNVASHSKERTSFENRALRKIFGLNREAETGERRKLHSEQNESKIAVISLLLVSETGYPNPL